MKTQIQKEQSVQDRTTEWSEGKEADGGTSAFPNNRVEAVRQRQVQQLADDSVQVKAVRQLQAKMNRTSSPARPLPETKQSPSHTINLQAKLSAGLRTQGVYQLLRFEGWERGRWSFISGWTQEALDTRKREINVALDRAAGRARSLTDSRVYQELSPAQIPDEERRSAFAALKTEIQELTQQVAAARNITVQWGQRDTILTDFAALRERGDRLSNQLASYDPDLQAAQAAAAKAKAKAKAPAPAAKPKAKSKAVAKPAAPASKAAPPPPPDPLHDWQLSYRKKSGMDQGALKKQIPYLQDQIDEAFRDFGRARDRLEAQANAQRNPVFSAQMRDEITHLDGIWPVYAGVPKEFPAFIARAKGVVAEATELADRAGRGWNHFLRPQPADVWWRALPTASNDEIRQIARHQGGDQHTADHRPATVQAFQTALAAAAPNAYFQRIANQQIQITTSGNRYNQGWLDDLTVNQSSQCLERLYQYVWTNGALVTTGHIIPGTTKKELRTFTAKGVTITLASPLVVIVNTLSNDLGKDPGTAYIK